MKPVHRLEVTVSSICGDRVDGFFGGGYMVDIVSNLQQVVRGIKYEMMNCSEEEESVELAHQILQLEGVIKIIKDMV